MDTVDHSTYLLEVLSLESLLTHLNTNTLKTVSSNKGISPGDLEHIAPYENFVVTGKLEDKNYYTYFINDEHSYFKLELKKLDLVNEPDIVVFTKENDDIYKEKKEQSYKLKLLLTENFDKDIMKKEHGIKNRITRFTKAEGSIQIKKQTTEEAWNSEILKLYEQKKALIIENKKLYKEHLEKPKISNRTEYIANYRINLKKAEKNKNIILEINKRIELLERKKNLYLSELYWYDPTSLLIITSLEPEEYQTLNKTSIKLGGSSKIKVHYELEYLDLDNIEEQINTNNYYKTLKTNLKKGSKHDKNSSNKDIFQKVQSVK
jgi:hypothetical protein